MKTLPGGLAAWLASNVPAWRGDLITLTLIDGATKYRWTTADTSITTGGFTWTAAGPSAPLVTRGAFSQSARLTIDTLDVTLVGGSFAINGKTLGQLAREQYFRGARLQLDHLVGPDLPGALAFGPIASFFEGRVALVEPAGPAVVLRIKSELSSLNVLLPKFLLGPPCGNTVYDSNCALNRATFTDTGTVSSGTTVSHIQSTTAAIIARPAAYYNLGVITFTSGANNGLRRAIQAFSVAGGIASIDLALPFPVAPAIADAFSIYPGCDLKRATCANSNSAVGPAFNNLVHWRGYPKTPNPESGA